MDLCVLCLGAGCSLLFVAVPMLVSNSLLHHAFLPGYWHLAAKQMKPGLLLQSGASHCRPPST
jgi:hypothetical protein